MYKRVSICYPWEAMKRKPRPTATPEAAAKQAVRIGFSSGAAAVFMGLSDKVKAGLRRKLRDFGENPAIGKPLVGELKGYHRVTYGRVRTVSMRIVVSIVNGIVLVHVLHVGLRKDGAADDPYQIAAAALVRRDPDALAALEALVQQLQAGELPELAEPGDER